MKTDRPSKATSTLPALPTGTQPDVLIVGATGCFGQRILRASVAAGFTVTAATRNPGKHADRLSALGARAVAATDDPRLIDDVRPRVVIDASGRTDLTVARQALKAGCHYVDIADQAEQVMSIESLDIEARRRGVCLLSGASSVPTLSGAVVEHLIEPGDRVDRVQHCISASDILPGVNSLESLLRCCGEPLTNGRIGLCGLGFTWPHGLPAPRLVVDCDVPDLVLFPRYFTGAPRVRFRAGVADWSLMVAVRTLASLKTAGLLQSPAAHAALFHHLGHAWSRQPRLHRGTSFMQVNVTGRLNDGPKAAEATDRRFERSWTLIAHEGDGLWIPALGAVAATRKLLAGTVPPGAGPCLGIVDYAGYVAEFEDLDIAITITERGERADSAALAASR